MENKTAEILHSEKKFSMSSTDQIQKSWITDQVSPAAATSPCNLRWHCCCPPHACSCVFKACSSWSITLKQHFIQIAKCSSYLSSSVWGRSLQTWWIAAMQNDFLFYSRCGTLPTVWSVCVRVCVVLDWTSLSYIWRAWRAYFRFVAYQRLWNRILPFSMTSPLNMTAFFPQPVHPWHADSCIFSRRVKLKELWEGKPKQGLGVGGLKCAVCVCVCV